MELMRQYVISVTTAAIVCGMLTAMLKKGPMQSLVKLLCGFFLAFTFLNPIGRLRIDPIPDDLGMDYSTASETAKEGERLARNSLEQIIKQRFEAYILDKASDLNLSVEVEVILSDGELPVPQGVQIRGLVPEPAKGRLEAYLEDDLGIAKENQTWIG